METQFKPCEHCLETGEEPNGSTIPEKCTVCGGACKVPVSSTGGLYDLPPVSSTINGFELIEYSPKCIVLRGDTKPHREKLGKKGIGGVFNYHLKHPKTGEKFEGWIFGLKKREQVEAFIKSV